MFEVLSDFLKFPQNGTGARVHQASFMPRYRKIRHAEDCSQHHHSAAPRPTFAFLFFFSRMDEFISLLIHLYPVALLSAAMVIKSEVMCPNCLLFLMGNLFSSASIAYAQTLPSLSSIKTFSRYFCFQNFLYKVFLRAHTGWACIAPCYMNSILGCTSKNAGLSHLDAGLTHCIFFIKMSVK